LGRSMETTRRRCEELEKRRQDLDKKRFYKERLQRSSSSLHKRYNINRSHQLKQKRVFVSHVNLFLSFVKPVRTCLACLFRGCLEFSASFHPKPCISQFQIFSIFLTLCKNSSAVFITSRAPSSENVRP